MDIEIKKKSDVGHDFCFSIFLFQKEKKKERVIPSPVGSTFVISIMQNVTFYVLGVKEEKKSESSYVSNRLNLPPFFPRVMRRYNCVFRCLIPNAFSNAPIKI